MKLLMDTHVLIWWLTASPRLSAKVKRVFADPAATGIVSAASVWEIVTKFRLGKLPEAAAFAHGLPSILAEHGFLPLSISVAHADLAGSLPGSHRDPFDRILAAQAILEAMPLVTADPVFRGFGAQVIW